MDWIVTTRWIAAAGLVLGLIGILMRLGDIMNRPFKKDLSRERGRAGRGILYAFTLGMAPWEKESTRLHWFLYIRGILFHVGIFTAFGVLFASPWIDQFHQALKVVLVLVTGAGALAGFAGIAIRLHGANERALSIPDDYFSVFVCSLFITGDFVSLLAPAALPFFYLVTAFMGAYIPLSKIRHCVYFFYSKFFFGAHFGHRGVIGQSRSKYAE